MNQPKRQHWVPKFYLAYFATPETLGTDKPRVWIFPKRDPTPEKRLVKVEDVCNKRFLYSPKDATDQYVFEMESKLADFESAIGAVWPKIATDFLDLNDATVREALALFVATMRFRHPGVLNRITMFSKFHLSHTHLGLKDEKDLDNFCKKYFVALLNDKAMSVAERLMKKRWSIVTSDKPTFVTSDNPVAVEKDGFTAGFTEPGAKVTFPLSQTRMLIMDDMHREPANQYYRIIERGAEFNFSVWHASSRFLITGRSVAEVMAEMYAWGIGKFGNRASGA